jgi:hypothetical protein
VLGNGIHTRRTSLNIATRDPRKAKARTRENEQAEKSDKKMRTIGNFMRGILAVVSFVVLSCIIFQVRANGDDHSTFLRSDGHKEDSLLISSSSTTIPQHRAGSFLLAQQAQNNNIGNYQIVEEKPEKELHHAPHSTESSPSFIAEQSPPKDDTAASESSHRQEPVVAPFCRGMPMTMFMDGFHWSLDNSNSQHQPPCLNYLIESWLLDQGTKFRGAMLFTFLLAFFTEGLSAIRGCILRRVPKRTILRAILLSIVYGLQTLMGYMIMFVAMMYSVELFFSVAVGLAFGNAIFLRRLGGGDDDELVSLSTRSSSVRTRRRADNGANVIRETAEAERSPTMECCSASEDPLRPPDESGNVIQETSEDEGSPTMDCCSVSEDPLRPPNKSGQEHQHLE